MQNFSISNQGIRLDGTVFDPAGKRSKNPTILFIPGWTSERGRSTQYATALCELGYKCVTADLRGHGTSEGDRNESTNEDFLTDVLAFYDHTAELEDVDASDVAAVGSSFGGYLVAMLAGERRLKNLVLRAPADYAVETFHVKKRQTSSDDPRVAAWRKQKRAPGATQATKALAGFTGNVLVIESELDERIPHQTIENYLACISDPSRLTHIVIPGAPHSIPEGPWRDKVEKILIDWFKSIRKEDE